MTLESVGKTKVFSQLNGSKQVENIWRDNVRKPNASGRSFLFVLNEKFAENGEHVSSKKSAG